MENKRRKNKNTPSLRMKSTKKYTCGLKSLKRYFKILLGFRKKGITT